MTSLCASRRYGRITAALATTTMAFACGTNSSASQTSQTLWRDGSGGEWLGQSVSTSSYDGQAASGIPPCGDTISTVAAADSISGDTQCLQVLNKECSEVGNEGINFNTIATVAMTDYSAGHFQFDLETVGGALSQSFSIGFGESGADAWYGFSQAAFGSESFTHASIPITDFGSYANVLGQVNQLTLFTGFTGNQPFGFVLCDVELTSD